MTLALTVTLNRLTFKLLLVARKGKRAAICPTVLREKALRNEKRRVVATDSQYSSEEDAPVFVEDEAKKVSMTVTEGLKRTTGVTVTVTLDVTD